VYDTNLTHDIHWKKCYIAGVQSGVVCSTDNNTGLPIIVDALVFSYDGTEIFRIDSLCANPIAMGNPPSGFPAELQFQPVATSQMQSSQVFNADGGEVIDRIYANVADSNSPWLKDGSNNYLVVQFHVDLYGPYFTQGSESSNASNVAPTLDPSKKIGSGVDVMFGGTTTDPTGTYQDIALTGITKAGYYYAVISMVKSSQSAGTQDVVLDNFYSHTWINTEIATVRARFGVTSSTGSNQYVAPGTVVDTLTVHAYNSNGTTINDAAWPLTSNGTSVPIRFCVAAYGPFQQPQATNQSSIPVGAQLAPGSTTTNNCHDIAGPTDSTNNQFTFNTNTWAPGYYYFVTTMVKSAQTASAQPFIIGDYQSAFNPSTEQEWVYIKFQPVIWSQALCAGRSGCTSNGSVIVDKNSGGTYNISDRIYVAAANGSWIENADYWPKDGSGNYIPATAKAYLYGPFYNTETRVPVAPAKGSTTSTVPSYSGMNPVAEADLTISNGPNGGNYYTVNFYRYGGVSSETNLNLGPGFYYAVVSINSSTQTAPMNNLISNFYSAWGDPNEMFSLTWNPEVDTEVVSHTANVGDTVSDRITISGFPNAGSSTHDVKDSPQITHGSYTNAGNSALNDVGTFKLTLFGPYDHVPVSGDCRPTDPIVHTWNNLPAANTSTLLVPGTSYASYTFTEAGYYVYYAEFTGDMRATPFHSDCADLSEQIQVLYVPHPTLQTQIHSTKPKAPTVITDTVLITGDDPEPNSHVKLTLYRAVGVDADPEADVKLCTVNMTVSATGMFTTNLGTDGTPANGTGKCFAARAGYYYWLEEFTNPDDEPYQEPHTDGPGPNEDMILDEDDPSVSTSADATALVGAPFKDVATVTLPAGSDRHYNLIFRAYGPQIADGSDPVCESSNLLFTSNSIPVNASGNYTSNTTTAPTPGNVYWIESLVDRDTGQEVASGECGRQGEITIITKPDEPEEPPTGSANVIRDTIAIVVLGVSSSLALWKLTSKRKKVTAEK